MKSVTYKGNVELWEANGALFSSEEAFNAEYVIFCAKYKEILALKQMGVENIVCIKNDPERLKNFIRYREGRHALWIEGGVALAAGVVLDDVDALQTAALRALVRILLRCHGPAGQL